MLRLLTIVVSLFAHVVLGVALVADYTGKVQRVESFYEGDGDDVLNVESTIRIAGLATLGDDIDTVRASDAVPTEAREAIIANKVEVTEPVEEVVDVLMAAAPPAADSVIDPEIIPEEIVPIEEHKFSQEAQAEQVVLEEMVAATGAEQRGGDITRRHKHLGKISAKVNKHLVDPRTSVTATTVVRFSVDPDGQLLWSKVLKSSGSKRLDRAALKSIDRAAPFPPFPPGLITEAEILKMKFRFKVR